MTTQFRNLVFEGGGMRGIAYVGAMKVMEQHGTLEHIRRVGGTSAGAINALVYALGYDLSEQHNIMASTDFKKFMDDSPGFIRDIRRLIKNFGWYKGDSFKSWIGRMIEQKLGKREATFEDLRRAGRPDLYMIGTNLTTGYAEVFSAERHGDMSLATAVRISMSIPLFFAAIRYGSRRDVYVDGGVVLNYPVKLFDREKYIDMVNEAYASKPTDYYHKQNESFMRVHPGRSPYAYNRQTLGLRLDTSEEIALFRHDEPPKGKPIRGFADYVHTLISCIMQVQNNIHLSEDDWHRTLYIDTLNVGTTDFDLSEEKKAELIESGMRCAEKYFKWFEDPDESPKNRIQP